MFKCLGPTARLDDDVNSNFSRKDCKQNSRDTQAHLGMIAVCFFLEESSWPSHFLAVSPAGEGHWNALSGCLNGFVG